MRVSQFLCNGVRIIQGRQDVVDHRISSGRVSVQEQSTSFPGTVGSLTPNNLPTRDFASVGSAHEFLESPLLPTPVSSLVTQPVSDRQRQPNSPRLGSPGRAWTPTASAAPVVPHSRQRRRWTKAALPGRRTAPRRGPSAPGAEARTAAVRPSPKTQNKAGDGSTGSLPFLAPAALLGTGRSLHLCTPGPLVQQARPPSPGPF